MDLLCDVSLLRRIAPQCMEALSSTGTLACAGFAALIIDAQPSVAVLLDCRGQGSCAEIDALEVSTPPLCEARGRLRFVDESVPSRGGDAFGDKYAALR